MLGFNFIVCLAKRVIKRDFGSLFLLIKEGTDLLKVCGIRELFSLIDTKNRQLPH